MARRFFSPKTHNPGRSRRQRLQHILSGSCCDGVVSVRNNGLGVESENSFTGMAQKSNRPCRSLSSDHVLLFDFHKADQGIESKNKSIECGVIFGEQKQESQEVAINRSESIYFSFSM